jgi:hypothetical protein
MIKAPALVTAVALIAYLSASIPNPAIAAESTTNNEWNVSYSLGKFSHSNPPKPDQIFKIYYRVVNGTIDSVSTPLGAVAANVTSSDSSGGVLEVKYPRNYPYSNDPDGKSAGVRSFTFFAKPLGGRDIEVAGNGTATDCFFILSVPFTGKTFIQIGSAILLDPTFAFHGDDVPVSCISDTVVTNNGEITPLQQLKAGVTSKDIVCGNGFELIVQPASGKPYCATHTTIIKLSNWWQIAA